MRRCIGFNKQKIAFFDLDGTLLDVYDRYISVIEDYVYLFHRTALGLERACYIKLKQSGLKDHEIVRKATGIEIDVNKYCQYKSGEIEAEQRLEKDIVLYDVEKLRLRLREKSFLLYLLSMRRNIELAHKQLQYLKIDKFFDHILFSGELRTKANTKYCMIKNIVNRDCIIVGDSAVDMECANLCGMRGYMVSTGLYKYTDVVMYHNVWDIVEML